MVTQVRTHGRFALLLTQADEPLLVAGELRLLFTKRLTQDEGETAGVEKGYEVGAGIGSS